MTSRCECRTAIATKMRNCFEWWLVKRTCRGRGRGGVSAPKPKPLATHVGTHLPQAYDVVKVKLALEGDEDPAAGKSRSRQPQAAGIGSRRRDARAQASPEAKEEVEALGFLWRDGHDVVAEAEEGCWRSVSVNDEPPVERTEEQSWSGRTQVRVHLRVEDRDEVAQRRELLLHARLVAVEVLLLRRGQRIGRSAPAGR